MRLCPECGWQQHPLCPECGGGDEPKEAAMTTAEQIQEILDSQAFRDDRAFPFWIAHYKQRAEKAIGYADRRRCLERAAKLESLLAKIETLRESETLASAAAGQ